MLNAQSHKQKSVRDYLLAQGRGSFPAQINVAAAEIKRPFNERKLRGVAASGRPRLPAASGFGD